MKKSIRLFFAALAIATASIPALASPTEKALSECLVNYINGMERKAMATWMFHAMAAHPELKDFHTASQDQIDESDRIVGKLVTRLMTEDCFEEARAAMSADPMAIEAAFGAVGEVAMQELLQNEDARKALMSYAKHLDAEKLRALSE